MVEEVVAKSNDRLEVVAGLTPKTQTLGMKITNLTHPSLQTYLEVYRTTSFLLPR